ncbi:hypothetical protein HK105_202891 [Polyrhizophydium stewartii]|uniref:Methyltransferase type 11 domain-containing protein n=1 Tax=Polyrhizophydium stewartii TaxID=2732419 RepID=A0ABR4NDL1_9FUNG|nr:hypothetical protein HK105_008177 [Polyrhizophydium stewartii]
MSKVLRFGALGVAGLALFGAGTLVSYRAYRIHLAPPPPPNCHDPRHQRHNLGPYDRVAPEFDNCIGWDEFLMGMGRRRRQLLEHASGDVLEVSAGTGRNLGMLDLGRVTSLTLTDASGEMLKQAFQKVQTSADRTRLERTNPKFVVMDSERLLFDDDSFDTVVDTFGLCSHADPVAALREMARVCRKASGRVLLLEHGRTEPPAPAGESASGGPVHAWIDMALDKTSTEHAEEWGCWWNRDIPGLVKEAGLEIERLERFHLGTTYLIVCRPRREAVTAKTK